MTTRRNLQMAAVFVAIAAMGASLAPSKAAACGGLFCDNTPVSQSGERIVFTVNDDATISSLIQIQYFGAAEEFSWILPIPEAIDADAIQVPDGGDQVFTELHQLTDVRILAPPQPDCMADRLLAAATSATTETAMAEDTEVNVFASGEIGPFGFDVIGAEDPDALVAWLVGNGYRVDPPMEPLIDLYVREDFAFVAMRLLNGETANSIQPIEITYPGTQPMIPLRLTAVAAQPQMPVWVWIFGDAQAVPDNYAHLRIPTTDLTFSIGGFNDYITLVQDRTDELGGRAFITEYAGPSQNFVNDVTAPYLIERIRDERYLTRLSTYISPAEMTVDPVFRLTPTRADVSNIRDASKLEGLYDCERAVLQTVDLQTSIAAIEVDGDGAFVTAEPSRSQIDGQTDDQSEFPIGVALGGSALLVASVALYLQFDRRRKSV